MSDKPTLKTAKAINAALTGDYEFFPNEEVASVAKIATIAKKKKFKISKTLCPHKKEEMEYAGPASGNQDIDVYRCRPCFTWKRFPKTT